LKTLAATNAARSLQARQETTMKTKNSDRKLQLSRETVRQLNSRELAVAVGGRAYETVVRPSDGCPGPTGG
jgi:hypothetical protein